MLPPVSKSSFPGTSELESAPRVHVSTSRDGVRLEDSVQTLASIKRAFEASDTPLAVILSAIAEAAQRFTESSGAALAMPREGVVICCARSGEAAPELGSRLNLDSGISGECLRVGKTLRCDDTEQDPRVDPQVCRRLGLRSIALVPLRGEFGCVGILEAFSPRAYAYSEQHITFLERLAELAEVAQARELKPAMGQASEVVVESGETGMVANELPEISPSTRGLRYRVIGIAVIVLVAAGLWFGVRRRRGEPVVGQKAVQPESTAPAGATSNQSAALTWQAGKTNPVNGVGHAAAGIQRASKITLDDVTIRTIATTDRPAPAAGDLTTSSGAPEAIRGAVQPPQLSSPEPKDMLAGVLKTPVALPAFSVPPSQGVTGGVLINRVHPIYPPAAIPMQLEGTVILQAVVDEEGKIQNLKAISGYPILARAAMDAVAQWRYEPYRLNGKAVPMQTQITVSFKLP